jgi:phytoene dehydrogenase-like protein
MLYQSLDTTAAGLGPDAGPYRRLFRKLVPRLNELLADALAPPRLPRHPFLLAGFGLKALRPASSLARELFQTERARGLFAGIAAHSLLPLEKLSTSAAAITLALAAHAVGWPIVAGGAQQLTNALISYLKSLGGEIVASCWVDSLDQLPSGKRILLDVTPRQLLRIVGERAGAGSGWEKYRAKLQRYRYGVAAFKLDWALSRPVPWKDPECLTAGTVHLGGTLDEISESERLPEQGKLSARPFVLLVQPTLFDPSRAPDGKHIAWAYCHVPNGFKGDATPLIEQQVERFAPGFRDCILARSVRTPSDLENANPNLIGGDIAGGAMDLSQFFLRPTAHFYRTTLKNIFLCSSSTPPGPGVHGMCGYWAAESALSHHA